LAEAARVTDESQKIDLTVLSAAVDQRDILNDLDRQFHVYED